MLRARSAEARAKGVTLQDRFLGNTELVGRLGSLTAPLSNWMNELPPHRAVMQAVVGIHKDRKLPLFHRETFSKWFDQRKRQSRLRPPRSGWPSSRPARWSTTIPPPARPPSRCSRRTAST